MKLDSRLMAIANLVRKDKVFADIGTDHAYLPVYLVENGIIQKAIAADLRVGPLENARDAVFHMDLLSRLNFAYPMDLIILKKMK